MRSLKTSSHGIGNTMWSRCELKWRVTCSWTRTFTRTGSIGGRIATSWFARDSSFPLIRCVSIGRFREEERCLSVRASQAYWAFTSVSGAHSWIFIVTSLPSVTTSTICGETHSQWILWWYRTPQRFSTPWTLFSISLELLCLLQMCLYLAFFFSVMSHAAPATFLVGALSIGIPV